MRLRVDQEPSVVELAEQVKALRALRNKYLTLIEKAPRYSSQSLGYVGSMQSFLQGFIRTLRLAVEEAYKMTITPEQNVYTWMVRHSGWVVERYHIKANRSTAYQDVTGSVYKGLAFPFAETVLWRQSFSKTGRKRGGKKAQKADVRFEFGIWLGKTFDSDEHLIGTKDGVFSARTVRRLEASRRADRELLTAMKGLPWNREEGRPIGRPPRVLTAAAAPRQGDPAPEENKEPGPEAEAQTENQEDDGAEDEGEANKGEAVMESEEGLEESPGGGSEQRKKKAAASKRTLSEGPRERKTQAMGVSSPSRPVQFPAGLNPVPLLPNPEKRPAEEQIGAPKKIQTTSEVRTIEWEAAHGKKAADLKLETVDEVIGEDPDVMNEVIRDDGLDPKLVQEGIELELERMELFRIYLVKKRGEAKGKCLTVRWALDGRGDHVRARLVAREFRALDPYRDDLFTPAAVASAGRVIDTIAVKTRRNCKLGDASNAYFHADEDEDVYCEPPEEWFLWKPEYAGQDVVWQMLKKLYGRRKASQAYNDFFNDVLISDMEFEGDDALPNFYKQEEKELAMDVHQGDWYATGPDASLEWLDVEVKKKVMTKTSKILGVGDHYAHLKQGSFRTNEGMYIYGNEKYSKKILERLGMENCNPKPTPNTTVVDPSDERGGFLEGSRKEDYAHCVGVARFMVNNRGDTGFAVRELSKRLRNPTEADWTRLTRLARYLKGTIHIAVFIPVEGEMKYLDMVSDTDWAGDRLERKSTACGCISCGGAPQMEYTRGQELQALSSGEAEFYGGVSAVAEGCLLHHIYKFFGFDLQKGLWLDSTAAKAISQRLGVGRVKHLEIRTLWLQRLVKAKEFQVLKEDTAENVADIGTKALAEKQFAYLRQKLGMRFMNKEWTKKEMSKTTIAVVGATGNSEGETDDSNRAVRVRSGLVKVFEEILKRCL